MLRPRPLPLRYSGVAAAIANPRSRAWEGSIGRAFCVVETNATTASAAAATWQAKRRVACEEETLPLRMKGGNVVAVSATSEASPQVTHRQSLEFDLSSSRVTAAQEVTRCVSRCVCGSTSSSLCIDLIIQIVTTLTERSFCVFMQVFLGADVRTA